jgi:hypothetical protein
MNLIIINRCQTHKQNACSGKFKLEKNESNFKRKKVRNRIVLLFSTLANVPEDTISI